MTEPIEVPTPHRCHLGTLTDELAEHSRRGERGDRLAQRARAGLERLLRSGDFAKCCIPAYVAKAPKVFEREFQIPVASDEGSHLDTRVLLWPVGSKDGQHPHAEGWAVFAVARGNLAVHERRAGERQPEREVVVGDAEVLTPSDGVTHHLHNRGDEVALSVHLFGN
jgi:mannose-6-phosphate isomerase-like protein (cupin superfamily)